MTTKQALTDAYEAVIKEREELYEKIEAKRAVRQRRSSTMRPMRSRRALAALLAGVVLLGACSTGWSDDDRDYLVARCANLNPNATCISSVQALEDSGCTVADAEGFLVDMITKGDVGVEYMTRTYPSCGSAFDENG